MSINFRSKIIITFFSLRGVLEHPEHPPWIRHCMAHPIGNKPYTVNVAIILSILRIEKYSQLAVCNSTCMYM